jgi:rhodanese-related sulfurtransferase
MSLSFVQTNWMLIAVFLLSGAMLVWPLVQRQFGAMKDIGTSEVTRLINRQNAVLLDVREAKEYEGGRLPNAVHIPLSQLGSRAQELAKMASRPIVAYCATGRRSRMAAGALTRAGFKEMYSLHGGIEAWRKDSLPLEK